MRRESWHQKTAVLREAPLLGRGGGLLSLSTAFAFQEISR